MKRRLKRRWRHRASLLVKVFSVCSCSRQNRATPNEWLVNGIQGIHRLDECKFGIPTGMYIVSYHAIHSLTINFYIISWSLFILNARFRIPSTPDISSPHVSSQRKLIGKLTGPTPDFFRCNASFNQPKIPGWKDHIVVNPQSFCIWSRRRPSSLGSKASSFVPFTQHMRMYKRDVFRRH